MPANTVRVKLAILAAAVALAGPLGAGPAAATPSFDCRAVSNAAERAVCADQRLGREDQHTARLYDAVLARAGRASDQAGIALIRETQRGFIQRRNACGWDPACIRTEYHAINRQLHQYMRQLD